MRVQTVVRIRQTEGRGLELDTQPSRAVEQRARWHDCSNEPLRLRLTDSSNEPAAQTHRLEKCH